MALTASQLVTKACSICKAPGFTQQCGQYLNMVLGELCLNYDLQMNRLTFAFSMAGGSTGPVTLPTDYNRPYDCFYYLGGEPFKLTKTDLKTFDDDLVLQGYTGTPDEFATDLSPLQTGGAPLLYVYPAPSIQTSFTLRYMRQLPDINTPEASATVPWFPDQVYLLKRLSSMLMMDTDDERQPEFQQQAQDQLRKHLIMDGDEQAVVKRVNLDPRTFPMARSGGGRATKAIPY